MSGLFGTYTSIQELHGYAMNSGGVRITVQRGFTDAPVKATGIPFNRWEQMGKQDWAQMRYRQNTGTDTGKDPEKTLQCQQNTSTGIDLQNKYSTGRIPVPVDHREYYYTNHRVGYTNS